MLDRPNQQMSTKTGGLTPSILILYFELCYALYRLSNNFLCVSVIELVLFSVDSSWSTVYGKEGDEIW